MSSAFSDLSGRLVRDDLHVRVESLQPIAGRFAASAGRRPRAVQNLPLQVARVDHVEVDEAERADAGRGQIERRRRAEPAGADAQHARRLELALTLDADLRHDQVPAVALHFVVGQFRQIGRGGRAAPEPARDRRHDADRVLVGHRRLFARQIADVFVVQVDVDEAPQLAVRANTDGDADRNDVLSGSRASATVVARRSPTAARP